MEKRKPRYLKTVEAKLEVLDYAEEIKSDKAAARHFGCEPKSIRNWRAQEEEMRGSTKKSTRRLLHPGGQTKYSAIEGDLYDWIISKISRRKPVTTSVIIAHMRQSYSQVAEKTDNALSCFLRRFLKRNLLVFRKPTHEGQALPSNFQAATKEFQQEVATEVLDKRVTPDRVVNMDETPLYFAPSISHVVAEKGAKTVAVDTPKKGNKRVTLILAVASDGSKLPPLLIFKGEFGKTLHKKLQKNTLVAQKRVYACCDPKAWNGQNPMKFWIDNIWNTHSRNMQNNILILDDYKVHKVECIKTKLENLRTTVCLIPGGLTRFLQPLDVGVNHIVKQEVRNKFAYMMANLEREQSNYEIINNVIRWVDEIWNAPDSKVMPRKIINSFAKSGLIEPREGNSEDFKNEEKEEEKSLLSATEEGKRRSVSIDFQEEKKGESGSETSYDYLASFGDLSESEREDEKESEELQREKGDIESEKREEEGYEPSVDKESAVEEGNSKKEPMLIEKIESEPEISQEAESESEPMIDI
eukprot:TRINITY_DN1946_c0_g1_i2.p1 TRINITY_DN1946_c0_g1~~TRINITY_DN1946_c0_g1_i2.p1  ORF type:complete len:598 (-),score=38.42 TRINITY_DN1946_c0_g1_i2:314-1894(-)